MSSKGPIHAHAIPGTSHGEDIELEDGEEDDLRRGLLAKIIQIAFMQLGGKDTVENQESIRDDTLAMIAKTLEEEKK